LGRTRWAPIISRGIDGFRSGALHRGASRRGCSFAQPILRAATFGRAAAAASFIVSGSEAGSVSGTIVKVHTKNVNYKGYIHHASADEPQYEIKSDKTDHIALHKAAALKRLRR
jgi:hypothetical protein